MTTEIEFLNEKLKRANAKQAEIIERHTQRQTDIEKYLAVITEEANLFQNKDPEKLHWGDIGDIGDLRDKLKVIHDKIAGEGEYAK